MPPAAIEKKPEPLPGMAFYFDAFQELQTERSIGMAAGLIPWQSIINYGEHHGVSDPDELQDFIDIIRRVEAALQKHDKDKNGE